MFKFRFIVLYTTCLYTELLSFYPTILVGYAEKSAVFVRCYCFKFCNTRATIYGFFFKLSNK